MLIFFQNAIKYMLGYTRFSLSEDRAHDDTHVQRVYLAQGAQGFVFFLELAYEGGLGFGETQKIVPEMLEAIAYCDPQYQQWAYLEQHNHVLDVTPFYFPAFAALAMFIALHRSQAELLELLVATGAAGQDQLFDRVAQRINARRAIGTRNKISLHYDLLVTAMDAAPVRRPDLLSRFLELWYRKIFIHSGLQNAHRSETYFGYSSYEAAAVVMLWDIDDSIFRAHPCYPDALVDYYRAS